MLEIIGGRQMANISNELHNEEQLKTIEYDLADTKETVIESSSPTKPKKNIAPKIPITTSEPLHVDTTTTSEETIETGDRTVLRDKIRQTIRKIPSQLVQDYLHNVLSKEFDIMLMGSPRVGKSTLINGMLKKNLAKTSPGL
ncbi:unnamed protein product [Didymodactylos carnosus]|uniref:G domain-containing protein n=1 Tax=Didymodactylos carnosus TaxID=1234261 RepID=A0A8S2GSA0_9BILA|nr:unnamed protein product [Didymodactylos carnosus]CAF3555380.1 unnamed protein product [Didymodactylos carnosus]